MSEAKPHSAIHAENYIADNRSNGTKEKKKVRNLRCENCWGSIGHLFQWPFLRWISLDYLHFARDRWVERCMIWWGCWVYGVALCQRYQIRYRFNGHQRHFCWADFACILKPCRASKESSLAWICSGDWFHDAAVQQGLQLITDLRPWNFAEPPYIHILISCIQTNHILSLSLNHQGRDHFENPSPSHSAGRQWEYWWSCSNSPKGGERTGCDWRCKYFYLFCIQVHISLY